MFYWSCKDTHVVLDDEEEMALVQQFGKSAQERIGYHTSQKARRDIEQRIFRHLEQCLQDDPKEFNRRYVFRSYYGEDAQRMFPIMLDAYGRVTHRATIGSFAGSKQLDDTVENIYYAATDEVFTVTLLERRRWPWTRPVVSGHISLPASSIEKVAGSVDNFFAACARVALRFHPDFVRVSLLDAAEQP